MFGHDLGAFAKGLDVEPLGVFLRSPAPFFQRSVLAMVKVAMAVPPGVYFISGSLPRYPISRVFCMKLVSCEFEVEKWCKTVDQASPAFAISRRRAARKRSSAEGAGEASVARVAENPATTCRTEFMEK
jgi:hypothetical protein